MRFGAKKCCLGRSNRPVNLGYSNNDEKQTDQSRRCTLIAHTYSITNKKKDDFVSSASS